MVIAAYLGKGDEFDKAIVRLAVGYADHTENDHAAFVNAVGSGRLPVVQGV